MVPIASRFCGLISSEKPEVCFLLILVPFLDFREAEIVSVHRLPVQVAPDVIGAKSELPPDRPPIWRLHSCRLSRARGTVRIPILGGPPSGHCFKESRRRK